MSVCSTPDCGTIVRGGNATCSYCRQKQYQKKCAYIDPEGQRCGVRSTRIYCDQHITFIGPSYNACSAIVGNTVCGKRCLGQVCAAHNPVTRQRIRDKRAARYHARQQPPPAAD